MKRDIIKTAHRGLQVVPARIDLTVSQLNALFLASAPNGIHAGMTADQIADSMYTLASLCFGAGFTLGQQSKK